MSAELTLLDLRLRRRSAIGYSVGMAVYAFVIVALYPSFKGDTSLDQFTQGGGAKVAALFGASGTLTSSSGWMNANLYGNFVPLLVLMMTIGYGAHAVAGQNEDGVLGAVATLPVSRRALVAQKFAAMCVLAAPVAAVTLLCGLAAGGFQIHLGTGKLIEITVAVLLLGVDFGALALLVGALTGSRGLALGIASGVAAAAYLISSLAPVVHWVHPARFVSPFYYAVGDQQLVNGTGPVAFAVLAGLALALFAAALAAFERLDLR